MHDRRVNDRSARYLWLFVGAIVLTLAAIASVNLLADPYALVNASPHRMLPLDFAFEREIRFNLIASKQPQTLFFGSSQMAVGIHPSDPVVEDARAFNAAIDGGTLTESLRLLREAVHVGHIQRVILGISYNMTTHAESDAFNGLFLRGTGAIRTAEAFTSITMFRSSLKSLLDAFLHRPLDMSDNGQLTPAVMARQLRGFGSVRAAFDTISRPSMGDVDTFAKRLRAFLSIACGADASVTLLLLPDHATDLELFAAAGQWQQLKHWKRSVVAAGSSAPCPVRMIDFEDYNFVTTEPLPSVGSARGMKYYWDPGHFTSATGTLILARVFAAEGSNGPFGIDLTPANVDVALRLLDEQRYVYEKAHPAEVAAIAAAVLRSSHGP